mgnify:CR=1 FL=1|tara:strand:+ start:154 stop:399 length:246 start_codon:yes stop_codon:yes gene_type:complete
MMKNNVLSPTELVLWCDSELAIVLNPDVDVDDPVEINDAEKYLSGSEPWPQSRGTMIQLVSSGEIFSVHNDTLDVVNHDKA